MTSELFSPLTLRGHTFENRVFVSPMCQYSARADGIPTDWHFVHLGRLAVGGASLVITEATAVAPAGRISPGDTGLWNDDQVEAWRRIVGFIHGQGAAAGIQLGHAGRKASTAPPWEGNHGINPSDGGWTTLGPSPVAFGGLPTPRPMSHEDIQYVIGAFASSTRRAADAGFDVIELHAAHGYLAHQFLSPLSNRRTDEYGGSFEGRSRFLIDVVEAMRSEWSPERPFFVRLSATDWVDGGWSVDETVAVSRLLRDRGVDLIDCSSGGSVPDASIPVAPGYQVPFARRVRKEAQIATGAVGRITEPHHAEQIIKDGSADAVLLGKAMLRNPSWPLLAAVELDDPWPWPNQYATSRPRRSS